MNTINYNDEFDKLSNDEHMDRYTMLLHFVQKQSVTVNKTQMIATSCNVTDNNYVQSIINNVEAYYFFKETYDTVSEIFHRCKNRGLDVNDTEINKLSKYLVKIDYPVLAEAFLNCIIPSNDFTKLSYIEIKVKYYTWLTIQCMIYTVCINIINKSNFTIDKTALTYNEYIHNYVIYFELKSKCYEISRYLNNIYTYKKEIFEHFEINYKNHSFSFPNIKPYTKK